MLTNRCGLICAFVLLVITAASPHRMTEVEGDSIILPCRGSQLHGKHLAVHWRHNDTRNVFDIIEGRMSVREQHPAYSERVFVSPEESRRGDFSLRLHHLQLSDGGTYLCFVPAVGVFHNVELIVKERSVEKHRHAPLRSRGTETTLRITSHLLLVLTFILHCI